MTKVKSFVALFIIALLTLFAIGCLGLSRQNAIAQSVSEEEVTVDSKDEELGSNSIEPRGWFTSVSLKMNGGDSKVWVTATNDVTIFPATVYVIVELYSSSEYQEKYENMTLVATNSILDLDMGKSISAICSTGGVEKYWHGRMRYKIDNKAWEERSTGTVKYSATGEYLPVL